MPVAGFPIHPEQNTRQSSFEGIRIREDTLYTNAHGEEKEGVRKRAEKALQEVRGALLKILGPDEAVFYVASAQVRAPMLEEYFLGWLARSSSRGLLILTNRRLIYFITDRTGRWRRSIRAAQWGDIEKAQIKGLLGRMLVMKYRNGSKETFWRLRRVDAAKIKLLLAALLPTGAADTSTTLGMVHLCPNCFAPLRPGVYVCGACNTRFRDEKTLARRSWFFPGLGYYYAGHPGLAVLDLFLELVILLEIAVRLEIAFRLDRLPHPTAHISATLVGVWIGIAFFVALWAFKRWLIVRHCRRFIREFIPVATSSP